MDHNLNKLHSFIYKFSLTSESTPEIKIIQILALLTKSFIECKKFFVHQLNISVLKTDCFRFSLYNYYSNRGKSVHVIEHVDKASSFFAEVQ